MFLRENQVNGSIPSEIGNLKNLVTLDFGVNLLSGPIPPAFGNLTKLKTLYLDSNKLDGLIPLEIGNLKSLYFLCFEYNNLVGPIPSLNNLTQVRSLSFSHNHINGTIPPGIGSLKFLCHLNIQHNKISGPIPSTFGNLTQLKFLALGKNQISACIPSEIGNLKFLIHLTMSNTHLTGHIPSTFELHQWRDTPTIRNLARLKYLDLSYNNVSGQIPDSLEDQFQHCSKSSSAQLIASEYSKCHDEYHNFQPSFRPQKVKRSLHYIEICLPVGLFLAFLILGLLFVSRWWQCKAKTSHTEAKQVRNGNAFTIWNHDARIAFDIISATEGFDIRHCIGTGGYGSVYKAQLPCGKVFAVKKLH
ncbi:hypothetical protein GH714_008554 [Hevea brasiliensis]|uniref:Protein kinase domain-containing protein n=1 Tax=Hevea brasiliensis TaxID=3981 RepID=A0A6A6KMU6_HEVBR|nr:hypothetical protein GH714_008554 [Hevea brasiliensis]